MGKREAQTIVEPQWVSPPWRGWCAEQFVRLNGRRGR